MKKQILLALSIVLAGWVLGYAGDSVAENNQDYGQSYTTDNSNNDESYSSQEEYSEDYSGDDEENEFMIEEKVYRWYTYPSGERELRYRKPHTNVYGEISFGSWEVAVSFGSFHFRDDYFKYCNVCERYYYADPAYVHVHIHPENIKHIKHFHHKPHSCVHHIFWNKCRICMHWRPWMFWKPWHIFHFHHENKHPFVNHNENFHPGKSESNQKNGFIQKEENTQIKKIIKIDDFDNRQEQNKENKGNVLFIHKTNLQTNQEQQIPKSIQQTKPGKIPITVNKNSNQNGFTGNGAIKHIYR